MVHNDRQVEKARVRGYHGFLLSADAPVFICVDTPKNAIPMTKAKKPPFC